MKIRLYFSLAALVLCTNFLCGGDATLSKSDRKSGASSSSSSAKSKPQNANEEGVKVSSNKMAKQHPIEAPEMDEDKLKGKILAEHNRLDTAGERNFQGAITLAYITPWNNHGYDVAKWAARKFTHISPVWFQLRAGAEDGKLTCHIGGTHDIDMGWIQDILVNNSDARIVPRFIWEHWTGAQLDAFLNDEGAQRRCARAIIPFLQRHNFHGAVMEMWLQIMVSTKGTASELLLEMVEFWAGEFRNAGLLFILPLTPPLGGEFEEIGIANVETIRRLLNAVDFINLMAYDYPSTENYGVAPIGWVMANLRFLLENAQDYVDNAAAKILLGLNFYGYDRSGGGRAEAVLGKKFIELLSLPGARLSFDEDAGEHRLTFGEEGLVYFPTQQSIGLRLEIARSLGLGGVAIWDLGQGLDHFTYIL